MAMRKILTIDRRRWLRGEGGDNSYLLRHVDRKMCCLGFDALACGLTEGDIEGVGGPEAIPTWDISADFPADYLEKRVKAHGTATETVDKAMRINDDKNITDADREAKLIPLLKSLGWDEVVFIN